MISVVLFDKAAVFRIIKRAQSLFFDDSILAISGRTLWLNGCYFEFRHDLLVINPYNYQLFTKKEVFSCLSKLLLGEEAYILDGNFRSKYFANITSSETFDCFLQN